MIFNSSVVPFRWLKTAYSCFYCYEIFEAQADLKHHTLIHDDEELKHKTILNYSEQSLYVDISCVACRLCDDPISDFNDLKEHLAAQHDVAYEKSIGDTLVPFKLHNSSVGCPNCSDSFDTFGLLLTHTNRAHKLTSGILCEICGMHCKDTNLLRVHIKTIHQQAVILCTVCGEKFETKNKLLTHERNKHNKKYKCLVCPETFQSHYKRSQHMAAEHKNRTEIKCLYCTKTFVFRSNMMSHVRTSHLNERNHICGVCGWRTNTGYKLKNHMYKHSGEKNFKCEVCDKAFTTRKIMRSHFLRMHKDKAGALEEH